MVCRLSVGRYRPTEVPMRVGELHHLWIKFWINENSWLHRLPAATHHLETGRIVPLVDGDWVASSWVWLRVLLLQGSQAHLIDFCKLWMDEAGTHARRRQLSLTDRTIEILGAIVLFIHERLPLHDRGVKLSMHNLVALVILGHLFLDGRARMTTDSGLLVGYPCRHNIGLNYNY